MKRKRNAIRSRLPAILPPRVALAAPFFACLALGPFLIAGQGARASPYYNLGAFFKTQSTAISSISPTSGFANTTLTVQGSGFSSGTTVSVGGTSCSNVQVQSSSQLTCTIPSGSGTGLNVVVSNSLGTATLTAGFSYASCSMSYVAAVPSNCGTGTSCQIIANSTSKAQSITGTAGDLLVAIAYAGQNPGGSPGGTDPNMTFTVTDTLGNTYYPGPMINNALYNDSAIQIFYAPNILGGSDTVTATSAGANLTTHWTGLVLLEYSGAATSDVVSVATGQAAPSTSTTATTPGSMTTSTGCDLIVAGAVNGHTNGGQLSAGTTGFTLPVQDSWDPGGFVHNSASLATAGTAENPIITFPYSDNGWAAAQMAFRSSATQAPAQPTQLAFTTSAQSLASTTTCSGITTIQAQNSAGQATATSTGIKVTLSGSPTTITYYADPACSFSIDSGTTGNLLIGAGTSSASFYFKGGVTGSNTITGSATGFTSIQQTETN